MCSIKQAGLSDRISVCSTCNDVLQKLAEHKWHNSRNSLENDLSSTLDSPSKRNSSQNSTHKNS